MSLTAAFGIATGEPTVWPVGSYAVTTPAWLSATVSGPCWAASNVIPQALRRWGSVWAAIPGVSATRLTCVYPRAAAGGALAAPHPTAASPTTAAMPVPRIRALVAMPDLLMARARTPHSGRREGRCYRDGQTAPHGPGSGLTPPVGPSHGSGGKAVIAPAAALGSAWRALACRGPKPDHPRSEERRVGKG